MDAKRIVCGGRGRGKMSDLEEWLQTLTEEERKKVVIVRASDKKEELRGNRIRRIICDTM